LFFGFVTASAELEIQGVLRRPRATLTKPKPDVAIRRRGDARALEPTDERT